MIADSTAPATKYCEDPLCRLETLDEEVRRLQARLADLQLRRQSHAGEVARALLAAHRAGTEYVRFNDRVYFYEFDAYGHPELHYALCAAAHEVPYDPAGADGPDWHPDDVVTIPPGAPVPAGYDPLHAGGIETAYDRDGRVIGSRAEDQAEGRRTVLEAVARDERGRGYAVPNPPDSEDRSC